ncbi:MAG: LAGLIDADG family homing endonuclease [Nanoarchaeota archaeon]|nr:LAGLIDADG family homing endonuclease [Nanoarchaeota archaeon]
MPYNLIVGRNESDLKKYGDEGTILLGRTYVQMGRTTSLSNYVYMDVAKGHVVYVVGKRGSGKCLHRDTLITLDNGSQVKISDLESVNDGIFTLDENFKIQNNVKTDFYKRPVNRLLEIKLRTGKTIKLTPEHPLLTINGWVPAEKLNLGSRIATPRKLEAFGDSSLKECEVKLLAYLIAEGHLGNNFVLFANGDYKIVNDFKKAVYEFDKNLKINNHGKFNYRVVQNKPFIVEKVFRDSLGRFKGTKFASRKSSIRKWLDDLNLYGKSSYDKFVPNIIFNTPKHQVSLFLNRLFSCDGTIYKKAGSWFVSYATSSYDLIRQVQHLLLRFAIVGRIRKRLINKKFVSYEVEIYGENANRFLQEIGFYGKKEQASAIALKDSIKIIRNPNLDTIPKGIWDSYRPDNWAKVGRDIGYAHPKALRESIRYSPSRQKLLQIALADECELLEKFATSDIFWDEIVSLNYLNGKFEVYDITVPDTHNFVANDIIVHNSYSLGVIAEGMIDLPEKIKKNISIIILDTMGIYWTMKYPNEKDSDLLDKWGLQGKGLGIKIYTPFGFYNKYKSEGIPTDVPFAIKPSALTSQDWALTFEIPRSHSVTIIIEKLLGDFADERIEDYSIDDMIEAIKKDNSFEEKDKNEAVNRLRAAKRWGLFKKDGTDFLSLAKGGQVTVLDVSCYATGEGGWGVKNLVIGLVAQTIFNHRMLVRKEEELDLIKIGYNYFQSEAFFEEKDQMPIVWVVIDEAHEFLPKIGKTAATDALVTIMREGRQPGVCLILATQQPGKIHTDVMSQSDIVIAHRLTAKPDVDALATMSQSYLTKSLPRMLDELPRVKGSALILDDNSERFYPIRVRPRFTWHGGEAPSSVPYKRKLDLGL